MIYLYDFRELDIDERPPPKIQIREVMSAMLDVVKRGGAEAVKLRKEGRIRK